MTADNVHLYMTMTGRKPPHPCSR